jgi:hypothetical protein
MNFSLNCSIETAADGSSYKMNQLHLLKKHNKTKIITFFDAVVDGSLQLRTYLRWYWYRGVSLSPTPLQIGVDNTTWKTRQDKMDYLLTILRTTLKYTLSLRYLRTRQTKRHSALPIAVYVLFASFSVHSFAFSLFPMYQGLVYRYRWDLMHRKIWKKWRSGGEVTYTAIGFNLFIVSIECLAWGPYLAIPWSKDERLHTGFLCSLSVTHFEI